MGDVTIISHDHDICRPDSSERRWRTKAVSERDTPANWPLSLFSQVHDVMRLKKTKQLF